MYKFEETREVCSEGERSLGELEIRKYMYIFFCCFTKPFCPPLQQCCVPRPTNPFFSRDHEALTCEPWNIPVGLAVMFLGWKFNSSRSENDW